MAEMADIGDNELFYLAGRGGVRESTPSVVPPKKANQAVEWTVAMVLPIFYE